MNDLKFAFRQLLKNPRFHRRGRAHAGAWDLRRDQAVQLFQWRVVARTPGPRTRTIVAYRIEESEQADQSTHRGKRLLSLSVGIILAAETDEWFGSDFVQRDGFQPGERMRSG